MLKIDGFGECGEKCINHSLMLLQLEALLTNRKMIIDVFYQLHRPFISLKNGKK